ncbi:MAG: hypothetical protein IJJ99_07665 [Oscillospiraceae bacterium]|nr:hypothetical protein [Oscillospiraceae bacterium]
MKKLVVILCLFLIVSFTACSVKEDDSVCVKDSCDMPPIPAFCLNATLPENTVMAAMTEDGQRVFYVHDDFTICKESVSASSADEAFQMLTGRTQESLRPVTVTRFPQEEYRYSCTVAGEYGEEVCTGVLFFDGTHGYSLQITCDARAEKAYRGVFAELLENTTLDAV